MSLPTPNVTRTLAADDGTELVLQLRGDRFTINGSPFSAQALWELADVTEWMADRVLELRAEGQAS